MTCKTCTATFNTTDIKPNVSGNGEATAPKSLSNRKCGKEVVSISRVDDNIIVSFADCTYSVTTADKVDKSVITKDDTMAKLLARVEALETKPDNDTVFDPTEINTKLEELSSFDKNLADNLVEVQNFNGETSYKAVSKDYNPKKEK